MSGPVSRPDRSSQSAQFFATPPRELKETDMQHIAGAKAHVNSHSASANKKFTLTVKVEPDGEIFHLEGRPAWAMTALQALQANARSHLITARAA